MSLADDPKVPSYAKCGPCEHVWVYVHVPCRLDVIVQAMKRATCPMCGERKRLFVYEPGLVPASALAAVLTKLAPE